MARNPPWSQEENEAIVADYCAMLEKELRGEPVSKAAHRRNLQSVVRRTEGAIEYKHQNISAVMMRLGQIYLLGYLPATHYQEALRPVVQKYLNSPQGQQLERDMYRWATDSQVVTREPALQLVKPPVQAVAEQPASYVAPQQTTKNYLLIEAMNHAIGEAGETLVLEHERKILYDSGQLDLSKKVEHVAQTRGPSAGYDILSYDRRGKEKWIDVKTTRLGIRTPFFITKNELCTSKKHSDNYWLYRIFDLTTTTATPQLYTPPRCGQ